MAMFPWDPFTVVEPGCQDCSHRRFFSWLGTCWNPGFKRITVFFILSLKSVIKNAMINLHDDV